MNVAAGLVVTVTLGVIVKYAVRAVGSTLPMDSPSSEVEEYWEKLRTMQIGGNWTGTIERLIFFASLLVEGGWPILSSWLAFKLAYYWQGANFTAFPLQPPTKIEAAYLVAKRQLGANHVATQLVGTGLNILIAFVGVAVSKAVPC
jgi:hypothetical protein